MKRTVAFFTGIIVYTAIAVLLSGYGNIKSHREFNGVILDEFHERFIASSTPLEKFRNYSFAYENGQGMTGPAVTKGGLQTALEGEKKFSLKKWLEEGGYSADEPELPASFRHFYDPTKQPGEQYLKDHLEYLENKLGGYINFNPRIDQLNWAIDHPDNPWTWNKGADFVRAALETADEGLRSQYMAKAYRCLGHTLHLIADMGCPAHVRDDSHPAPFSDYALLEHFGSPDPYEELFEKIYGDIDDLAGEPVDEQLLPAFRSAGNVRNIAHRLAAYTNEKFFTNQTIKGNGVMPQIHPEYIYSLPDLADCSYHLPSWTFQQMVSGTKIKMCKDLTYFWWTTPDRGYPYIDFECVKDQASVLVPQIIEAGANAIRLFIPELEVTITSLNNNTISGSVVHTTDSVYTTPIYYNGKVDIIRKDDQKKLGTVDAVNGQFSGSINVGEDVAAYAQITFGDITVQSPDYAAGGHTSFSINLSIPCSYRWDEYHPNGLHFTGEQNFGTTIENIPLTKQGNQYSANWNYSENGAQRSGSATLTLQGKQSVMVEFSETISNSSGGFTETLIVSFVASQGIPFSMSVQNYDLFNVSGQVYPYVANYYSKSDNPDRVIETTGVLSNPQYNGSITVFLFY